MTDLRKVETSLLRRELNERLAKEEEELAAAARAAIRKEYGVCTAEFGVTGHPFTLRTDEPFPEGPCGQEFRAFETAEYTPILVAPDDWPPLLPVPPERAVEVGCEYVFKLTCPRGHETFVKRTQMHSKPMRPLF